VSPEDEPPNSSPPRDPSPSSSGDASRLTRREALQLGSAWLAASGSLLTAPLVVGCDPTPTGISRARLVGRIAGDSMAPHYLSDSILAHCPHCGNDEPLTTLHGLSLDWCCPRCGRYSEPDAARLLPAEQPAILSFAPNAAPQRWQEVAIRFDDQRRRSAEPGLGEGPSLTFKRLWGLPGERVAIVGGTWLVDGNVVPRDWATQCAMRVLVHADGRARSAVPRRPGHAAVRPSAEIPARVESDTAPGWRVASPGWSPTPNGWRLTDAEPPGETPTDSGPLPASPPTLEYAHYRCVISGLGHQPPIPAPIEDFLAYDPFRPRRLFPVFGLMLEGRVEWRGAARLSLSLHDGIAEVRWTIERHANDSATLTLFDGEAPLGSWPIDRLGQRSLIGLSTFDRCATLAIDGVEVQRSELPGRESRSPQDAVTRPARITAERMSSESQLSLQELTVWRDLLPLAPNGTSLDWELGRALEKDEYFAMGDHFAASLDNRLSGRGTRRHEIIGTVDAR